MTEETTHDDGIQIIAPAFGNVALALSEKARNLSLVLGAFVRFGADHNRCGTATLSGE